MTLDVLKQCIILVVEVFDVSVDRGGFRVKLVGFGGVRMRGVGRAGFFRRRDWVAGNVVRRLGLSWRGVERGRDSRMCMGGREKWWWWGKWHG
jgi:hypothetical protein